MTNDDLLDPGSGTGQNYNGKALPYSTAVLVLGICSLVGCIIYGIPGLICGIIALVLHKKDKAIYNSNPEVYEMSFKNSKAGYICAIIGTILSGLFLAFLIVYVAFIVSVVSALPIR